LQTWQDFEVIIQDGLSTDNTLAIADDFRMAFANRLRIRIEKDLGIYDGMNRAIKKAKGKWIYSLGADDYLWDAYVFSTMAPVFNQRKIDFVYGNVESPVYGLDYDGPFTLEKLMWKNICHQAIFVRRKLYNNVGIFNTGYEVLADWDFNFRCFVSEQVYKKYVPVKVAFYAPNGTSENKQDDTFNQLRIGLFQQYLALAREKNQRLDRVLFKEWKRLF